MRTLEEAIKHAEYIASKYSGAVSICWSANDNRQLAVWLRELQERRKQIIFCHECEFFQCNIRFDGSIPKGADEYECRHWCGGCDPMDYCSCGKRRERRTDADD